MTITLKQLKQGSAVPYSLPTATDTVLGGVKVGEGLSIDNAVLKVLYNRSEKIQELGNLAASATVNLDLTLGQVITATCQGAATWNVTSGMLGSGVVTNFTLVLTNPGTGTQTWPTGTVFDKGIQPILSSSGSTALMFESYNNGTSWIASQIWRSA